MKSEELHKIVVEVEKLLAKIGEKVDLLGKTLDTLNKAQLQSTREVNDFQRQSEKELVAVKKDIDELRRWCERSALSDLKSQLEVLKEKVTKLEAALEKIGTRAWSVVPNVAGAIVNVILAAVVALVVSKLAK